MLCLLNKLWISLQFSGGWSLPWCSSTYQQGGLLQCFGQDERFQSTHYFEELQRQDSWPRLTRLISGSSQISASYCIFQDHFASGSDLAVIMNITFLAPFHLHSTCVLTVLQLVSYGVRMLDICVYNLTWNKLYIYNVLWSLLIWR